MSKAKLQDLPAAEKERRWKQSIEGRGHFASKATAWIDSQLKKIPKGTFGKIGHAIAGAPGQVGGDIISYLTGRGDYNIKKNSLIQDGNVLKPSQMSFSATGAASIRMRRREFIGDVIAPTDPTKFTQTQYRLQPTDTKTFPWLSTVAEHFTEWELHGAILTYETTCSNFASDMALGTISIATQYNANETPFSEMREILQAAFHSRGNPSENVMHGVECDPALQASEHLFTRRSGTHGPPNLYDHGVVTVATEGLPAKAGTVLGRLFITYDVELNLPVLPVRTTSVGMSLTLWTLASSSTLPPMGDPLAVSPQAGNMALSYGTSNGNNVMSLLPSNGPWARPNVPAIYQSSLVAWVSNSTTIGGTQYLSFANAGVYLLEMTFFANTGDPPGDLASVTTLTSDVELHHHTADFNGVPFANNSASYIRVVIQCASPDQSISLFRKNASNCSTWTVLTVCA